MKHSYNDRKPEVKTKIFEKAMKAVASKTPLEF